MLVVLQQTYYIFEFLDRYKQCCSQNEIPGRVIALTGIETFSCSLRNERKYHPKWPQLGELYEKREAALKHASLDKQRSEFKSINDQVFNLHEEIDGDIINEAQILIEVNTSIMLTQSKHLNQFNPDVQIIDDVGIFNKSQCYAMISQVFFCYLIICSD